MAWESLSQILPVWGFRFLGLGFRVLSGALWLKSFEFVAGSKEKWGSTETRNGFGAGCVESPCLVTSRATLRIFQLMRGAEGPALVLETEPPLHPGTPAGCSNISAQRFEGLGVAHLVA